MNWRYYDSELDPRFWSLVQSLEEMSRRWNATSLDVTSAQPDSIFLQFAIRLRNLYEKCNKDETYCITMTEVPDSCLTRGTTPSHNAIAERIAYNEVPTMNSYIQSSSEKGSSTSNQNQISIETEKNTSSLDLETFDQVPGDNLTTMSQVLMDPGFIDMDRVISFNDMVLTDDLDGLLDENTAEWAL